MVFRWRGWGPQWDQDLADHGYAIVKKTDLKKLEEEARENIPLPSTVDIVGEEWRNSSSDLVDAIAAPVTATEGFFDTMVEDFESIVKFAMLIVGLVLVLMFLYCGCRIYNSIRSIARTAVRREAIELGSRN